MRTFLVILAALFVTVFADQTKVIELDKSDKFTHAEFNYPKGKYGSLNLVSLSKGDNFTLPMPPTLLTRVCECYRI